MADQVSGYAVLPPQGAVHREESHSSWGGGAAYILVWVVVIILVIALLAALFMGAGDWMGNDSSSQDEHRHSNKRDSWNLSALGGLVVFVIVLLFLAWLISSAGCYGDRR